MTSKKLLAILLVSLALPALAGDLRTIHSDVLKAQSDNANSISVTAPASLAASWNFKLPPDDGSSGQVLRTDGSGTTTWVSPASGAAIGGGLTSGTLGSVLFSGSATIEQDNANFFWDDTNNRLGIGTASPGQALVVNSADTVVSMFSGTAGGQANIAVDHASQEAINFNRSGVLQWQVAATSFGGGTNQDLTTWNNGTSSVPFHIDGDTNFVGIGTATPSQKLTINDATQPIMNLEEAGSERLRITAGGALGVGGVEFNTPATASYAFKSNSVTTLSVTPTRTTVSLLADVPLMRADASADLPASPAYSYVSDTDTGTYRPAPDTLAFATAATERMRIDSTGNVGIGTAAPAAKLDVDSDTIRLRTAKTPSSASDTCDQGELAWDADYVYVCVATDTWKRTAIATW